ncbi:hypothetical protein FRC03_012047 [Tulasnella sp. 419]|nr:hypothetical protein FRC03_012047 [Tulasnella sp. 419]
MTFKLPLFLLALTGPLITVTAGPVNPAPDLLDLEGPIQVLCPHVSRGFESDRVYTVVVTGTERSYHDKWLNRCFYIVTYSPSRFSKNTETAVVSTAVNNQWIGEGDVAGFKKVGLNPLLLPSYCPNLGFADQKLRGRKVYKEWW